MAAAQKLSATNLRNFRTFLLMQQFAAKEIGARIAQARAEAGGMTQPELAEALDVSTRSVQAYEAGDVIPWKHFKRLEQLFNRQLEWFLHGEEHAPNGPAGAVLASVERIEARLASVEGNQGRLQEHVAQIRLDLDALRRARGAGEAENGG